MFMGIEFGSTTYAGWPISLVFFAVCTTVLYLKERSFIYLFFFSIFWIYITFAINEVFFPIAITWPFAEASRDASPNPIINLIPFYFGPYPDLTRVIRISILNIVLTIPFGFGLNFLTHVSFKRFLLIAVLLGFGLEVAQFILSLLLGYFYRIVDVNDVMFNALGVIVGYSIFRVFAAFYIKVTTKREFKHNAISDYIRTISLRVQNNKSTA